MPFPFDPYTRFFIFSTIILTCQAPAYAVESVCGPITPNEAQLVTLQQENATLSIRIKQLEEVKCISVDHLRRKKFQRLLETASHVKAQRQTTSDFQGFVRWMNNNLSAYNSYIKAGSYAAIIGRILPIPYAGQASIFTKFVTQFTAALNESSIAITRYLDSSQKFISMVERIQSSKAPENGTIMEAAQYADQRLLKDMNNAQVRLSAVSDLSSGALSFLASLNHLVNNADDSWNRAKGLLIKEHDKKEKSYLRESMENLRTQADSFNKKLKSFDELGKKETASVKSLAVYDELEREAAHGGLLE